MLITGLAPYSNATSLYPAVCCPSLPAAIPCHGQLVKMASYDPPIPPDNSSRQSPFSALPTLLMLSWQQVLMHHAVSSRVAEHHIINWKNGLSQDSSDTFAYWTRYCHDEPDGKECADTMLCAMQEVSQHRYCYLDFLLINLDD